MIKFLNFILKPFGYYYTYVTYDEYDCVYGCYRPIYVCKIMRIK